MLTLVFLELLTLHNERLEIYYVQYSIQHTFKPPNSNFHGLRKILRYKLKFTNIQQMADAAHHDVWRMRNRITTQSRKQEFGAGRYY